MPAAGRTARLDRVTPRLKVWLELDGQYVFGSWKRGSEAAGFAAAG
ncbi:MAG TPA: hypothetical protein VML55_17770 [Planctomycetaceae bacterium]|nr:hypothetical protein [Planctomycetaceae bacterium]